jgi:hypothetical protein
MWVRVYVTYAFCKIVINTLFFFHERNYVLLQYMHFGGGNGDNGFGGLQNLTGIIFTLESRARFMGVFSR